MGTPGEHGGVLWWKVQGAGPLGPVSRRVTWDDEGKVRICKLGGILPKARP